MAVTTVLRVPRYRHGAGGLVRSDDGRWVHVADLAEAGVVLAPAEEDEARSAGADGEPA
jgi:hypothetical protein